METLEKKADVVVIGGGISGCATAYNLAKRGAKVVLVEKGEIASEASGKTFAAVRKQGRDPAEMPMARTSLELWEHLSEEMGCDTDFVRGGHLAVAETEEELAEIETYVKEAQQTGINSRLVTPEEARKIVPALECPMLGAMYCPDDGQADAVKTTTGFANAAREHGAKIYTHCHAIEIGLEGGRVGSLVTSLGEIKTPLVVNAAGVWAPRLARAVGIHIPVKVVRMSIAETRPVSPIVKVVFRGPRSRFRQTVRGNIRFIGGYKVASVEHDMSLEDLRDLGTWVPRLLRNRRQVDLKWSWGELGRDLRRLFPARDKHRLTFPVFEPRATPRAIDAMTRYLFIMLPSMKGTELERSWAGLLDLTPDLLPVLGEVERPKGFILAAGFSGHGFALGPVTGKLLSELVLDGRPSISLDAFKHTRFTKAVPIPPRFV